MTGKSEKFLYEPESFSRRSARSLLQTWPPCTLIFAFIFPFDRKVLQKLIFLFLGYLAIFSCENSLNYLKETLKLIKEAEECQHDSLMNLPIILMLASESGREEDANFLRQEGQDLADQ